MLNICPSSLSKSSFLGEYFITKQIILTGIADNAVFCIFK